MQQEIRSALVLGTLSDSHIQKSHLHLAGWRVIEAPTMEAADAALSHDKSIRVGLWPCSADCADENLQKFPLLRAKHRVVQWLALLPPGSMEDQHLACRIAQNFFDFLTTPVEGERLSAWMGHAHGMSHLLERAIRLPNSFAKQEQMVGTSESMRQLLKDIRKVAASDAPIFISGESGTGKELSARLIHERSARAGKSFVAVDCGAIPPTLIQSELFGYEKGAFTGAAQRKIGRIEVAEGGTLFLDEIGDFPLEVQGNLLRFMQDSTIQRVGGTRTIGVDVRIIAATHVDLEEAVKQGRFREDLYYRLNVLRIKVPALRERQGDIEVLAHHFLEQFLKGSGKNIRGFNAHALDALRQHTWPGNIRELINRIRRATVMCEGPWITPQDLDLNCRVFNGARIVQLDTARDLAERQAIDQAIKLCSNNYSAAARVLGVSRVTLYRLLAKHRESENRTQH